MASIREGNMRLTSMLMACLLVGVTLGAGKEGSDLRFPRIADFGGVVDVPGAVEPPRRGTKIVFDVLAEGKPAELNKGLESVARYLNLNATAGNPHTEVTLAVVLHGGATRVALDDPAYARVTGNAKNPNLPLILALKKSGVEVLVCGQSLARHDFSTSEVAAGIDVAVSAMTVNANKQQDGYSYIVIP
ncbi:MAG: DsrE family protein [Planctomycetota bacterium]